MNVHARVRYMARFPVEEIPTILSLFSLRRQENMNLVRNQFVFLLAGN
jgi:hypothetical protein